jgi:hypothetical protein
MTPQSAMLTSSAQRENDIITVRSLTAPRAHHDFVDMVWFMAMLFDKDIFLVWHKKYSFEAGDGHGYLPLKL